MARRIQPGGGIHDLGELSCNDVFVGRSNIKGKRNRIDKRERGVARVPPPEKAKKTGERNALTLAHTNLAHGLTFATSKRGEGEPLGEKGCRLS